MVEVTLRSYRTIRLNPLWNRNKQKTIEWIDKKKKDIMKCRRMSMDENEEENEESDSESAVSTD